MFSPEFTQALFLGLNLLFLIPFLAIVAMTVYILVSHLFEGARRFFANRLVLGVRRTQTSH